MAIHPYKQTHSLISITLLYEPDRDVWLWVRARKIRKTTLSDCHAICIAEKLRAYIESRLHIAHRNWCGLDSDKMFMPEPVRLSCDSEGIQDALLPVPVPACFSKDWEGLCRLISQEATSVARSKNGRFLVYLSKP